MEYIRLSVSDAVKLTIHWYKEFYRKSSNNNLMTFDKKTNN